MSSTNITKKPLYIKQPGDGSDRLGLPGTELSAAFTGTKTVETVTKNDIRARVKAKETGA